jgi:GH25 family lysozyme M1 (1,4-beta-N-acetylmuramidase)
VSKVQPIYGIDISNWQKGIDLAQVAREGYEFCVVNASEGPYPDGTFYLSPSYRPHIHDVQAAGMLAGAYHFIVEAPAGPQVDLFLNTVGDVSGKLIMVDYESYPNIHSLDPSMTTLTDFVNELSARIDDHPILVYSGKGYWESPPPNGSIQPLHVTTWDAYYPLHPQSGFGSALYQQVKNLGWGQRWGDQEPKFWQFSANGLVAGMQVDVDAFSGTRDELYALAGTTAPATPITPPPLPVRPLVPPSFVPLDPDLDSPNYEVRHPTRYEWRPDVEDQIPRVYEAFPDVTINTYVDHPEGYGRDVDSFDVWGPGGRDDPIGFDLGQRVFDFIFNDPNPPLIEWCIWRRAMWVRATREFQQFGNDPFTFHDDHSHWTFVRP